MTSPISDQDLARLLRRTWRAFFGSFGALTDIQRRAIPSIISGKNTVIASPSASGKTEAAISPMVERLMHFQVFHDPGVTLLYIVPTRALVNDIYTRIRDPLAGLDITCARRTGDHSELNTDNPQSVLVTTPESFDSILCRHPGLWNTRMGVILDELHLLDGHYRGDQLRMLLRRLDSGPRAGKIRYAALSATFSSPRTSAARYFPVQEVVTLGSTREVEAEWITGLAELKSKADKLGARKLLVFCNTRARTEEVARELKNLWPHNRVLVHHGSLGRAERLEVEEAMKQWSWGVCVATSTLEVGIDIGDVDTVVLADLPQLPSSFQQRIARGSRRADSISVIILTPDQASMDTARELIELFNLGAVEGKDYDPDPAVLVQQILSTLFQHPRGQTMDEITGTFDSAYSQEDIETIILHLTSTTRLVSLGGRFVLSEDMANRAERGLIHSNIPDSREMELVDSTTGAPLGRAAISLQEGGLILFSGRRWRVVGTHEGRADLAPAGPGDAQSGFRSRREKGAFWSYLPESIQNRVRAPT